MSTGRPRPATRRPRRGVVLSGASVALGAALLAVTVLGLEHDRSTPANVHRAPAALASPARSSIAASTTGGDSPAATAAPSSTGAGTAAASPAALTPPAQLSLPTLKVTAPIDYVDTTNGVLGVPDNIAHVGWWTGSPAPGSPAGSSIIDGHVDSATTGLGALFHLGQLTLGDPVTITTTTGTTLTYQVYDRHTYVKHQGLPADLFTNTGPPRLVLITCGGPFDTATHNYEDNIVILATPTR